MSPTRVPVVVLQHGRLDFTHRCLADLRGQAGVRPEIWLVDASSPGASRRELDELGALADHRILLDDNLGFAGGNNRALARILAENEASFVFVLNNDTELPPDCLAKLVACAQEHPRAAQICPLLLYPDGSVQGAGGAIKEPIFEPGMIGNRAKDRAAYGGAPRRVTFASGCAVLVRLAAIRDAGTIPEEYHMYSEDVDWSLRFARAGWEVWCCPEALVIHHESLSTGRYTAFKGYYLTRSHVLLAKRWLDPAAYSGYLARMRAKLLRQSIKHALHPRYLLATWRGFFDGRAGVTGRVGRGALGVPER